MRMYSRFLARGLAAVLSIAAVGGGTVYAGSIIAQNDLIDQEAAENFALIDANVKKDDVSNMYSHLERDDGRYIYEVKFHAGDYEYEYEILAEDGAVLEKDRETVKKASASAKPAEANSAEAKPASAKPAEADSTEAKPAEADSADTKPAAGTSGTSKSSTSGAAEADSKKTAANKTSAAGTPSGHYISLEKAKQIALDDAGYTEDQVRFSTAKFEDDDDEGETYEIEFYFGNMEYEYEIDAVTGEILDSSAETEDD